MAKSTTIPAVFIIESIDLDDEKREFYEGHTIAHILRLNKINSQYHYIRTSNELSEVLRLFKASEYRYLHISCHGSEETIDLTTETLTYTELGAMINPYLNNRRVFISACSAVNDNMAKTLIPSGRCYSVIGPTEEIGFSDATIFWAAFYHLMFKENATAMVREKIVTNLRKVVKTFQISIAYYSRRRQKELFRRRLFRKKQTTTKSKREVA